MKVILSYLLIKRPYFILLRYPIEQQNDNLNNDIKEINKWALQRKVSFNPNPIKSAHKVIFSRNTTKTIHSKIFFNNISVIKVNSQRHIELHLDSKLSFDVQDKIVLTKVNKTID